MTIYSTLISKCIQIVQALGHRISRYYFGYPPSVSQPDSVDIVNGNVADVLSGTVSTGPT